MLSSSQSQDDIVRFYDPTLYDLKVGVAPRRDIYYLEEARRVAGPILELGCGTGDVLLPIAKLGIEIVGIDLSMQMISHLSAKLRSLDVSTRSRVKLCCMDMRFLALGTQFAAVFIPNQTVAHLLTEQDLQLCFDRVYSLLKPGGELILDTFYPDIVYLSRFIDRESSSMRLVGEAVGEQPGYKYRVCEQTVFDQVNQVLTATFRYELLDEERAVQRAWYRTLRLRTSRPEELTLRLKMCGFSNVQAYGDFQRRPLTNASQDVVIIAEKRQ